MEAIPKDWNCGIVITVHKKKNKINLDNYRGITLMDVVSKMFSSIIRDRLEKVYSTKTAEEQAEFLKDRGCVDQACTLAQMVAKRLAIQKNTFLCFVDLKKVDDSVCGLG